MQLSFTTPFSITKHSRWYRKAMIAGRRTPLSASWERLISSGAASHEKKRSVGVEAMPTSYFLSGNALDGLSFVWSENMALGVLVHFWSATTNTYARGRPSRNETAYIPHALVYKSTYRKKPSQQNPRHAGRVRMLRPSFIIRGRGSRVHHEPLGIFDGLTHPQALQLGQLPSLEARDCRMRRFQRGQNVLGASGVVLEKGGRRTQAA